MTEWSHVLLATFPAWFVFFIGGVLYFEHWVMNCHGRNRKVPKWKR
jgi:hypothetical protein